MQFSAILPPAKKHSDCIQTFTVENPVWSAEDLRTKLLRFKCGKGQGASATTASVVAMAVRYRSKVKRLRGAVILSKAVSKEELKGSLARWLQCEDEFDVTTSKVTDDVRLAFAKVIDPGMAAAGTPEIYSSYSEIEDGKGMLAYAASVDEERKKPAKQAKPRMSSASTSSAAAQMASFLRAGSSSSSTSSSSASAAPVIPAAAPKIVATTAADAAKAGPAKASISSATAVTTSEEFKKKLLRSQRVWQFTAVGVEPEDLLKKREDFEGARIMVMGASYCKYNKSNCTDLVGTVVLSKDVTKEQLKQSLADWLECWSTAITVVKMEQSAEIAFGAFTAPPPDGRLRSGSPMIYGCDGTGIKDRDSLLQYVASLDAARRADSSAKAASGAGRAAAVPSSGAVKGGAMAEKAKLASAKPGSGSAAVSSSAAAGDRR
jgi:hypothetical protein